LIKILIDQDDYHQVPFKNEDELEKVVVKEYTRIFGPFGPNSFYFNIKKRLQHKPGDIITIPDGYLLRVDEEATITIIENELSTHDPINHIFQHFPKYDSVFTEVGKYQLKKVLLEYLKKYPKENKLLKQLVKNSYYRSVDELLEEAIIENELQFAVIIDDKNDELERVLRRWNTEIILIKKFKHKNEMIYHIDDNSESEALPLFSKTKKTRLGKSDDIDTIVCATQEQESLNRLFLNEHRWFAVRIGSKMKDKIKYLAMYESAPISEINYIGEVKKIKPYRNSVKSEIVLSGPPKKIGPITLTKKNPHLAPQSHKYTIKKWIDEAETLEDIFG